MRTFKGKLVAVKQDVYTTYVFETASGLEMCTLLPNWNEGIIQVGEEGFVSVREVCAGDAYTNPDGSTGRIKYDNTYLDNFVRQPKENALIL